ncbi:Gfo/Idh/MocA family protein [Donghicola tyrosinivorans]|uniref:Putative dehydrogenase n=1 Tax=Donghicola tyrosinivorans TaxID=1652492 RepID=A0A2T0WFD0_9RHOB|nr:Gfo/Idh/MocA family oxidoreductase [Donghicola tyrosinivorans]PRY85234.1 putative dehydrogenase [Donghicola tyrosinivorans]
MTLHLGIVGMGHVAKHHVIGIGAAEGLSLVGTADPVKPSQDVGARCPHFASLTEMIEAVPMDVVVIATPPSTHLALAQEAFDAGVDVLLEKPATPEPEEYRALLQAAKRSGQRLQLAFHAAFGREMDWFKEARDEIYRTYGQPVGIECNFFDPYVVDGQLLPQAVGLHGSWRDSGINALSVLDLVLDLQTVTVGKAQLMGHAQGQGLDTYSSVDLVWPGGRGVINTSWQRGQNLKTTKVRFAEAELLLHHTDEVAVLTHQGIARPFDQSNGQPRLTNHYIGLFAQFAAHRDDPMFDEGARMHELLFQANEVAFNREEHVG